MTKQQFKSNKVTKKAFREKQGVTVFQPIYDWEEAAVYDYNTANGTRNNPLYAMGRSRVGCDPCIMVNDNEVGVLSQEAIERVTNLEDKVRAVAPDTKPVFVYKGKDRSGRFAEYAKKRQFNTLGLDLGCINHLGKCE